MLGIIAGALCILALYLSWTAIMGVYSKGLTSTLTRGDKNKFDINYLERSDPIKVIGLTVLNVFITPAILVSAGVMIHASIIGV